MKKLSKITESIWSDIQDRSSGKIGRKEDDVNLLDPDDFVAYIRKIYKFDNSPYDIQNYKGANATHIFIPIYTAGTKDIKLGAIYFEYDEGVVYTHNSIKKYIPKLWAKLDQDFDLWDDDPDYRNHIIITPKGPIRKVNNSYVLELLNYICDNLDDTVKPCIFRKTNESIWSDIQDRSAGKIGRKEDDINLLDAQGFVEYLRKLYKNECTEYYIFKDLNDIITVPTFETGLGTNTTQFVEYDCNKKAVYVWDHFLSKEEELFNKLNDDYKLTYICRNSTEYYLVEPKRGKSSNKFFIEIIDYILENASAFCNRILFKNHKVTESIWSDIQDRSTGKTIRKEDDVDYLDKEDFCHYLKENYKMLHTPYDIIVDKVYDGVCVKIYKFPGQERYSYLILKNFSGKKSIELTDLYNKHMRDLLFGTYKVTINSEDNYIIESYDGHEITNTFYIEVLDFLLKNADNTHNPCVKKIGDIKESIWSDIQDRSGGDTVRKEDEFSSICKFIKDHYFVGFVNMDDIEFKDDLIHVPIYKVLGLNAFSSVEIHKDRITFASINPDRYSQSLRKYVIHIKDDINRLFDKIKDTYSPEISTFDGFDHWIDFEIKPKDGKMTPKFCEEVIDFVLDNTPDDNHKILKILEKK